MKQIIFMLALFASSQQVMAGGAATGGSTVWEQVLQRFQAVDAFAQDGLRLQQQIIGNETLIRSLQDNPIGAVIPNLTQLVTNQAQIQAMGNDIGNNMSKVDQNFAQAFTNPQSAEFGVKFKLWTNQALKAQRISLDTSAGYQQDSTKNEQNILRQLTNKIQAANTPKAQLDAVADINAEQLKSIKDLNNLMAQQQAAQGAYMAAQVSKDQAKQEAGQVNIKATHLFDQKSYKSPTF